MVDEGHEKDVEVSRWRLKVETSPLPWKRWREVETKVEVWKRWRETKLELTKRWREVETKVEAWKRWREVELEQINEEHLLLVVVWMIGS